MTLTAGVHRGRFLAMGSALVLAGCGGGGSSSFAPASYPASGSPGLSNLQMTQQGLVAKIENGVTQIRSDMASNSEVLSALSTIASGSKTRGILDSSGQCDYTNCTIGSSGTTYTVFSGVAGLVAVQSVAGLAKGPIYLFSTLQCIENALQQLATDMNNLAITLTTAASAAFFQNFPQLSAGASQLTAAAVALVGKQITAWEMYDTLAALATSSTLAGVLGGAVGWGVAYPLAIAGAYGAVKCLL